jgi:methyl-accepting chemotaxis protein
MSTSKDTPARQAASFEALTETSKKVNEASKRLSAAVEKMNDALKKLNLGIPVWLTFCTGGPEDGHIVETEQLGYAKVKGKWGVCIRLIIEGLSPDDDVTEWHFDSAPRDMRIRSSQFFGKLLQDLNHESLKQAKLMEERAKDIDELTASVIEIANKAHGRVSLRTSTMEAE